MRFKASILAVVSAVSLSACAYTITGDKANMEMGSENLMKTKRCTFAPLWLAPLQENFANIDQIARESGMREVVYAKQKIYPYVLFTQYCTVVKGR